MLEISEAFKRYQKRVEEGSDFVWGQRHDIDPCIHALEYSILLHVGQELCDWVFEGRTAREISDQYTAPPNDPIGGKALWVKGAMERLDAHADLITRDRIMAFCGAMCAQALARDNIESTRAELQQFDSLDAYWASKGFHEGILYNTYHPCEVTKTRCYCLGNGLPPGETMSPTYCRCAVGHSQYLCDVHGLPVKVELLHSALCGADECRFEFRILSDGKSKSK